MHLCPLIAAPPLVLLVVVVLLFVVLVSTVLAGSWFGAVWLVDSRVYYAVTTAPYALGLFDFCLCIYTQRYLYTIVGIVALYLPLLVFVRSGSCWLLRLRGCVAVLHLLLTCRASGWRAPFATRLLRDVG